MPETLSQFSVKEARESITSSLNQFFRRMQLFAFFACFTSSLTLLLLPCESKSSVKPLNRRNSARIGNESRCDWHCVIVDSDFGKDMKKISTKYRLITMDLAFEQRVDENCFKNQTGFYNTTKPAVIWTWLTDNSQSRAGKNISKESTGENNSVSWFRKSFEGQIKVTVSCDFRPSNDSPPATNSINDIIAVVLLKSAANYTGGLSYSGTILCYKESVKNGSYACLNATASKASNISRSWPHLVLEIVAILVFIVLTMYSPIILCLFSPTEVNAEDGRCVIVLNGACPVGFRSRISNFFSTRNTIKWKFGLIFSLYFISFTAVLAEEKISRLFLPPLSSHSKKTDSFVGLFYLTFIFYGVCVLLCSVRYVLSIWFDDLSMGGQCLACKLFADKAIIHHGFSEELRQHLHIQPLIVVRCFTYCFNVVRKKLSFIKLTCLYIILLVVLAPLIAAVLLIALAITLVTILLSLLYSCPLLTLNALVLLPYGRTGTIVRHATKTQKVLCILLIYALFSQMAGNISGLVFYTTVFSLEVIRGILTHLPGYLPIATLVVVVSFYCWKCYSSFSRKYRNLALKLYKHGGYKTNIQIDVGQQVNLEVDKVPVIPKDLFEKACQDLMPLTESISLLVVKLVSLLTFVFVVFAVIMETPDASDRAKAAATFLTALVPKIIEMVLNKDPGMEKLDDDVFDEKVKHIVKQYRSTTESNSNGGDTSVENSNDNNNSSAENEMTALLNNVQIDVQDYGTSERSRNTDEVS